MRGARGELIMQQNLSQNPNIETKLTEFQIIEFILDKIWRNRLSDSSAVLPQLSQEVTKVLNTLQAQGKIQIPAEIPKIDTLIIEVDFEEFRSSKLLGPLVQTFGKKILGGVFDQGTPIRYRFQSIDQYIEKVKIQHDAQVK
jgi:DNA-binding TFAR19-related protein (PDSD5 family)